MARQGSDPERPIFDLLVVGGGIQGAAMALLAAQAGRTTLLVERGDFAAETSAQSQKVIHSGIRHLQQGDWKMYRNQLQALDFFLTQFPGQVELLKMSISFRRFSLTHLKFLGAVVISKLLFLLTKHKYQKLQAENLPKIILPQAPASSATPTPSPAKSELQFIWWDGFCVYPERVVMTILNRARQDGAEIRNYTEVKNISRDMKNGYAIECLDKRAQEARTYVAKNITLCNGANFNDSLFESSNVGSNQQLTTLTGVNVLGLSNAASSDQFSKENIGTALSSHATSHHNRLFDLPWMEYKLVGTRWFKTPKPELDHELNSNIQSAVDQLTGAFRLESVEAVFYGKLPAYNRNGPATPDHLIRKGEYQVIDSQNNGQIIQVISARFTQAFWLAQETLNKLDIRPSLSMYSSMRSEKAQHECQWSDYDNSLKIWLGRLFSDKSNPEEIPMIPHDCDSIEDASIHLVPYFVEYEQCRSLADLVFRRCMMAAGPCPDSKTLQKLALALQSSIQSSDFQPGSEIKQVQTDARYRYNRATV